VQLTQRFAPAVGGVESHVYHLAMELAKANVSIEVFTTDLQRDTPFTRLNGGLVPFPFPVRRFRATRFANVPHGLGIVSPSMASAILRARPDVIHAHAYGYFPTFVGGFAQLMRGTPLVVTPHSDAGSPTLSKRLFDWAIPAFTIRRAHRVIAVTKVEAHHLRGLGVHPDRIRVIPNGVDLSEFSGLRRKRQHRDEAELLFVGRVYPRQKGIEHIVKALALLHPRRRVRLIVIGEDWGGVERLRSLARSLGVEDRIVFRGLLSRDEVVRAYASAEVFVLPSLFEPFGIVLLEAMAAGLPIVASKVGGIVDVVEDGKTGLLVPPRNPEALADALERLLSNPTMLDEMGDEGRMRAPAYSWDQLSPRILDVYREAIAEGRREWAA